MGQVKHQKQKPKKQKKQGGRQADTKQFRADLDALGLEIVQVTADGNCFFRALADQLKGNEDEHGKYRSMVVHFISKNHEMFEPFIEDEVPFDEYCHNMESNGTWAGHMELQAASLVTRCNICIHQNMSPCWYIRNFDEPGVRMIRLSYHDGHHYNSVRPKEDPNDGPARSKNKACPCGSKKKYKSCCGSDTGRSSATIVNQAMETMKETSGKRRGKKGRHPSSRACGLNNELPDIGSLCI